MGKPQGFINFDGSLRRAADSFIICNWERRFIHIAAFNLRRAPVLVTEATVTRSGVKAVIQVGYREVHIEGGNKILLKAITGKIQLP